MCAALFRGLAPGEFAEVLAPARQLEVERYETIFREGDVMRLVHVIASGLLLPAG